MNSAQVQIWDSTTSCFVYSVIRTCLQSRRGLSRRAGVLRIMMSALELRILAYLAKGELGQGTPPGASHVVEFLP